jgi:hypothetical protein
MGVLVDRVVIEFNRRYLQMEPADSDAAVGELIDADNRHNLGNQDGNDQRQQKVQPEPLRFVAGPGEALFRFLGLERHVFRYRIWWQMRE